MLEFLEFWKLVHKATKEGNKAGSNPITFAITNICLKNDGEIMKLVNRSLKDLFLEIKEDISGGEKNSLKQPRDIPRVSEIFSDEIILNEMATMENADEARKSFEKAREEYSVFFQANDKTRERLKDGILEMLLGSESRTMTRQQLLFFKTVIEQNFKQHRELRLIWLNVLQLRGTGTLTDVFVSQRDTGFLKQAAKYCESPLKDLLERMTPIGDASISYAGRVHISKEEYQQLDMNRKAEWKDNNLNYREIVIKVLKPHALVFLALEVEFLYFVVIKTLRDLKTNPNIEKTIRLLLYITKEFIRETDITNEQEGTERAFLVMQPEGIETPFPIGYGTSPFNWMAQTKVGETGILDILIEIEKKLSNPATEGQAMLVMKAISKGAKNLQKVFIKNALGGNGFFHADLHFGNIRSMFTFDQLLQMLQANPNFLSNSQIRLIGIIDVGAWEQFSRVLQMQFVKISMTAVFITTHMRSFRETFEMLTSPTNDKSYSSTTSRLWSKIKEYLNKRIEEHSEKVAAHWAVGVGPVMTKLLQQLLASAGAGDNEKIHSSKIYTKSIKGLADMSRQERRDLIPNYGFHPADEPFFDFVAKHVNIREQDNEKAFMKGLHAAGFYNTGEKREMALNVFEANYDKVKLVVREIRKICGLPTDLDAEEKISNSMNLLLEEYFSFDEIFLKVAELSDIGTCVESPVLLFGRGAQQILASASRFYLEGDASSVMLAVQEAILRSNFGMVLKMFAFSKVHRESFLDAARPQKLFRTVRRSNKKRRTIS